MPDGDFSRITKVLALPKIINGAAARNSGAIAQTAATKNEEGAGRFLLFLSRARRVSLGILFVLDEIVSPWFLLRRPVAFASYNDDFNDITSFAFAYLFVQMYSLQFASSKLLYSHIQLEFNFVPNTVNFVRSCSVLVNSITRKRYDVHRMERWRDAYAIRKTEIPA